MVSFVENEQRSGAELSEDIAQPRCIDLVGQQVMRNNEARTRRPRVDRKAPQTPYLRYPLPVDDLERQTELRLKLVLPLRRHCRRGGNDDEIYPSPQQQLAGDKPRLDCLA